jgi:GAF domain-containing protein
MEPIPETVEAIEELEGSTRQPGLLASIRRMGEQVAALVPECVGLSLSVVEHGVTFTLVATSDEIRDLDATQYVDGGPCLRAVDESDILETRRETMDEEDWQLFAQATSAHGIASTLSMPILRGGEVTGGVNLYASSSAAFTGRHEEVAALLGAWAEGAVTNADLAFTTMEAARKAPGVLRDSLALDEATGLLVAARGLGIDEARRRLQRAAAQAGLPEAQVARLVLDILSARGG